MPVPHQRQRSSRKRSSQEIDETLLKARAVASLPQPTERDYGSVKRWFNDNTPLHGRDASYIRMRDDLVTIRRQREAVKFDTLIESTLHKMDCELLRVSVPQLPG